MVRPEEGRIPTGCTFSGLHNRTVCNLHGCRPRTFLTFHKSPIFFSYFTTPFRLYLDLVASVTTVGVSLNFVPCHFLLSSTFHNTSASTVRLRHEILYTIPSDSEFTSRTCRHDFHQPTTKDLSMCANITPCSFLVYSFILLILIGRILQSVRPVTDARLSRTPWKKSCRVRVTHKNKNFSI